MNFKQWNKIDRTIFAIAALLLLLFSYFLYDDSLLFNSGRDSSNEQVGTITKMKNDVRQKNKGTFSWSPAANNQEVRHLDSIFTGDGSTAQIRLNDGTVIKVQPNSLVTINMNQGQMQLDLKYGDLISDVVKDSNIQVNVNGENVNLKSANGSSIQIKKDKSGLTDILTLKGQATMESKNGSNGIKLASAPQINITDLTVNKMSTADPFDIPFKYSGDHYEFELIIAKDNSFQNIIYRKKTDKQKFEVQVPVSTGTYAWKIQSLKQDGSLWSESSNYKLQVNVTEKPEFSTPSIDSDVFKYLGLGAKELKAPIDMAWTKSNIVPEYEVQISDEASFNNTLQTIKTTLSEGQSVSLPSGKYFLRVRGVKNNAKTDWSQTREINFTVLEFMLESPQLTLKEINFKAPLANEKRNFSESIPYMSWKKVPHADKYLVQLSVNPEFKSGLQKEVDTDNFGWEKFKPGKYYYRVTAKSSRGFSSLPSEIGELYVNVNDPVIESIQPLIYRGIATGTLPETKNINVKWSEVPMAQSYLFEIDQSPNFSSPQKLNISGQNTNITIAKPGTYHVRVKALDQKGRSISNYSVVEKIIYDFSNQLDSPLAVYPLNDLTLFLQRLTTPFLRFEWKPVVNAKNYEFELSNSSDFSNSLMKARSSSPRLSVQKKLPNGRIFWRVRAIASDETDSSDWSKARQIQVEKSDTQLFIE